MRREISIIRLPVENIAIRFCVSKLKDWCCEREEEEPEEMAGPEEPEGPDPAGEGSFIIKILGVSAGAGPFAKVTLTQSAAVQSVSARHLLQR